MEAQIDANPTISAPPEHFQGAERQPAQCKLGRLSPLEAIHRTLQLKLANVPCGNDAWNENETPVVPKKNLIL